MERKTFSEDLNRNVFTTRFVIEKSELITYVAHELEDGAWQFYSESQFNGYEDIMVVTLKSVLDLDETLYELADLPLGYDAIRKGKNEKWQIGEL